MTATSYGPGWAGVLVVLACVALAGDASATCMERCTIQPVDASCQPWPDKPWPGARPLRVALSCFVSCSAPGGPTSTSESGWDAAYIDGLEVWRDGCAAPEPIELARVEPSCGKSSVVVANGALASGTYQLRGGGTMVPLIVAGAPPGPCPHEEAYRERLEKERLEQERLVRERQDQIRREQQARDEERRRQCLPPNQWSQVGSYCKVPPPHSEQPPDKAPAPDEAPAPVVTSFWDDGDWKDDRDAWGFSASLGAWAWAQARSGDDGSDESSKRGQVGGLVAAGFRHFAVYRGQSILEGAFGGDTTVDGLVWCAPVGCGVIGLFLMPADALVGNEHGLDLRASFSRDYREGADGFIAGVALHPFARVSRDSRFSTGTFFGVILPEVGLQFPVDTDPEMFFHWFSFPIDLRVGRYLALSWDGLGTGPVIPLDGSRVGLSVGTGLSFNLLAVSD